MWQKIRVSLLVFVLSFTSTKTYLQQLQVTDWMETLRVIVYPINGDGSPVTQAYIDGVSVEAFRDIEVFMKKQAQTYGVNHLEQPVQVIMGDTIDDLPPVPPSNASPIDSIFFSLRFRYWAAKHSNQAGLNDIRLFVVYHDPKEADMVPSSVGLEKGLMGLIHGFADTEYEGSNNVVIAHEMLHTLGATDKYDPMTNQPVYPVGFAEPYVSELYPQRKAEIMGGRIPLSESSAYMPESLSMALVGGYTATEIKWIR